MVEACGAPADFEALLVAQQVSYEYCAPLWSEAVATGATTGGHWQLAGHKPPGFGDGDPGRDASSCEMRPDVDVNLALSLDLPNIEHEMPQLTPNSSRATTPEHPAPAATLAEKAVNGEATQQRWQHATPLPTVRAVHVARCAETAARLRRARGAPTLRDDPRCAGQWAYPSEIELKGGDARGATVGMVGAEAPVTTFAEAACGYSLRRWGAIGLVVLDLARCGTVPTIERIGVGLGKAQLRWLRTILELDGHSEGRGPQSADARGKHPPLTTLLVVCEVPVVGWGAATMAAAAAATETGSVDPEAQAVAEFERRAAWRKGLGRRQTPPELHALLQELFEWRARSRGRNFSLVCAGLGVAVDTTVSECVALSPPRYLARTHPESLPRPEGTRPRGTTAPPLRSMAWRR